MINDQNQPELGRRTFLKTTAIVGAVMAAGPMAWAATDKSIQPLLQKGLKSMTTRKLGKLEVSAIGLGCMNMSGNYNAPADVPQSIRNIRAVYQ